MDPMTAWRFGADIAAVLLERVSGGQPRTPPSGTRQQAVEAV